MGAKQEVDGGNDREGLQQDRIYGGGEPKTEETSQTVFNK